MANAEQEGLVRYLNQRADPYDFQFAIEEWAQDADEPDLIGADAQVDDLNARQLTDFTKWLAGQRTERWVDELGPHAPSYLFFSNAKALPKGAWCVHLTKASPFTSFRYGALLWELGLTRHFTEAKRRENEAKCSKSPDERQPLYGFAFRAEDRKWRFGATRKYGRNAVFFQHDSAVVAHHYGDEEDQVIFDVCGAYNAVPVWNVTGIDGGGTVTTDEGDLTFDDWKSIITWAEGRGEQPGLAGLGSCRRRWAAGVRMPRAFHGLMGRR